MVERGRAHSSPCGSSSSASAVEAFKADEYETSQPSSRRSNFALTPEPFTVTLSKASKEATTEEPLEAGDDSEFPLS